jgi:hypothetical protein
VLAYDGTEKGTLSQAFDGLRPKIGKGCWDGTGLYVMTLSGKFWSGIDPPRN